MNHTCSLCLESEGEINQFINPICKCRYFFHEECKKLYSSKFNKCVYCRPITQTENSESEDETDEIYEYNARPVRLGRRNAITYVFDFD